MKVRAEITEIEWVGFECNDSKIEYMCLMLSDIIENYIKMGCMPKVGESLICNDDKFTCLQVEVSDVCYCDHKIMYGFKALDNCY